MRTVQLTLDEALVDAVDRAARELGTTRSGFAREALRAALTRRQEWKLEQKHREGYLRKPSRPAEIRLWEKEQVWGEP
jgi:metal-responsive CopG/Arc/MetJ family transcriptional regulator